MSRDMKNAGRTSRPASKKSGGGMLVGIFIGLIIGVLAALGVALYINKTPVPFVNKMPPPEAPKDGKQKPPAAPGTPLPLPGKPGDPVPAGRPADAPAPDAAPAAAPAPADKSGDKTADKNGDKPRFDFYKILPGGSDALPEPKADAKKDGKEAAKEPVYLQAGSFQRAQDAEGVKANLALLNLQASVQQVMVQDKVWYRVRLGPYAKPEDANKVRAELTKAGIETTIVKNKE